MAVQPGLEAQIINFFHANAYTLFKTVNIFPLRLEKHQNPNKKLMIGRRKKQWYMKKTVGVSPEVIKLFSCSAQLRLKWLVGILTFISRINYRLW